MSKFRIGDVIKYIESDSMTLNQGHEYTVSGIHVGGVEEGINLLGYNGWWYDSRFELVTRKENNIISILNEIDKL